MTITISSAAQGVTPAAMPMIWWEPTQQLKVVKEEEAELSQQGRLKLHKLKLKLLKHKLLKHRQTEPEVEEDKLPRTQPFMWTTRGSRL